MKRILFIAALLLSFVTVFTACGNAENRSDLAEDEVYSCPMHPQVVREEAGQCPVCHMDLEKRKMTPAEMEKAHKDGDHNH